MEDQDEKWEGGLRMGKSSGAEKVARGRAGELRVASELCRRGYCATVTMGNTPNTDVICANTSWTKTVFIQVKTFRVGAPKCQVGKHAGTDFGKQYFWVLAGLRDEDETAIEDFYIIPSGQMAQRVSALHRMWLATPGRRGQRHKDNPIREVRFGELGNHSRFVYDVREFKNRWDLIEDALRG